MQIQNLTPILILQLTFVAVLSAAKWTYNEGERHWSDHYPFCGGAFQSPIDINTDLLRFDPSLRPIEVRNYNLSAHEQLTLGNNGHSVQLSLPSRMYMSGLPHRYTAAQLHFHWGSPHRPIGSEHTVNSKQFAAEMHVVHFNSDKYANVSMAVDKSDGLAVLGVLIEVGEFNPYFERFLKFINGIKYRDQRVQVPGFNIRRLLPARLDEYYRYDGSLTTPPCYPSVLWTVFRNPVTISHKQFQALATALYSSHVQESIPVALNGNYRKPQHPDNRVVLVSFKEGRGLHGPVTVTSPLMRRQIVQQLLAGDLADLADEKNLYHLLPMVPDMASVGEMENDFKHQRDWAQISPKYQSMKTNVIGGIDFAPSLKKNKQASRHMGRAGLTKDPLCYVTLEHKVLRQLRRTHTQSQLVEALKEELFPELNLQSYLECKSDLALSTIRQILRGRPTDEAFELDRSLTKASMGHKKGYPATKLDAPLSKNAALSPAKVPGKSHSQAHSHPWLVPMEWED